MSRRRRLALAQLFLLLPAACSGGGDVDPYATALGGREDRAPERQDQAKERSDAAGDAPTAAAAACCSCRRLVPTRPAA